MKKKIIIIIIGILLVLVVIGALIFFMINRNIEMDPINKDFLMLGQSIDDVKINDNYVFTNYDDFKSKFDSDKLTKNDFNKYNYVSIRMAYDSCRESEVTPTEYSIDGKTINVLFKYKAHCGVCAPSTVYYFLKVDKTVTDVIVNVKSEAISKENCNMNVAYKPIIYLYPELTTDVKIELENANALTTTYPKYSSSWKVIANPDGKLIDKNTGREYYGLYWEGNNHIAKIETDGFVVNGEDTIEFLEEKLNVLGLTDREANEFIIYWLPKLEVNKYNYIRFEKAEEINNYMPLNISPKPDTLIRVLMDYKPLDEMIDVQEQKLTSRKRNGFTVVEWGGSLIN